MDYQIELIPPAHDISNFSLKRKIMLAFPHGMIEFAALY